MDVILRRESGSRGKGAGWRLTLLTKKMVTTNPSYAGLTLEMWRNRKKKRVTLPHAVCVEH